tara:strand:- start:568 stop:780 length:213 start_codon:yes stop_codon:yes gene_type:complete
MRIKFTIHALFRAKKRKIEDHEIVETINFPDSRRKKYGKHFFRKKFARGTIEVCCERTEMHIKVITIYWI